MNSISFSIDFLTPSLYALYDNNSNGLDNDLIIPLGPLCIHIPTPFEFSKNLQKIFFNNYDFF